MAVLTHKESKLMILIHFFLLTIGATIAGFAMETFLLPVRILDGGIIGIGIITNHLTGISLSILSLVLNLPFLFIGSYSMEKKFFLKAGYAMVVFSLALRSFSSVEPATEDALLATVFGGILLGIGVGLVIRAGGCLDGTETIAILLSRKTSVSVGQTVLIFNVIIFSVAGFLFGADCAMYSLLTYFITSKVIDLIESGLDQGKSVMIITDEGNRIARSIYNELGRTVTTIEGAGLISGKKQILYCVVTRIELSSLRNIVNQDDASAFMTVSDVSEIVGKHIKKTEALNQ